MLNRLRNLISRWNSGHKALKYKPESVASNEKRTRRELEAMCQRVREGIKDPAIVPIARMLTEGILPTDERSQAEKLFEYVRDCIHCGFRPFRELQPDFRRRISPPRMTMESGMGDCVDICVLFSALAGALGIPYRFVAVKFQGREYYHYIYPELYIGNAWKHFEFTAQDAQSGKSYIPEGATTMVMAIEGS